MSEIIKYKCNKCGKECKSPYVTIKVPSLRRRIGFEDLHLCENCASAFGEWLGIKIPIEKEENSML